MRLDYNRRLFVGIVILPHRMEDIIPPFDEVSNHPWAEPEERQFLDNLVNQFLELWRVESGNKKESRQSLGARLTVADGILAQLWRQREEDLCIRLGEMHHCADRSLVSSKRKKKLVTGYIINSDP